VMPIAPPRLLIISNCAEAEPAFSYSMPMAATVDNGANAAPSKLRAKSTQMIMS
jgi:hypothetical protein